MKKRETGRRGKALRGIQAAIKIRGGEKKLAIFFTFQTEGIGWIRTRPRKSKLMT